MIEAAFAIIKSAMGYRRFSRRELKEVSGEWTLVCLAWHVQRGRMASIGRKTSRKPSETPENQ
ncbi:transposase [Accumulibacter sp.]|uniref:transposase n=1 Tax=Accumulibacter sp. TaxID=2053492 RepID=UPI0026240411|nr:transposase [Accumulibacter sp.]